MICLWFVMLFLLVQGRWRLKPLCLGCMCLYVSMAQQQGMVETLSYPAFVGPSSPAINTQQSSLNFFNEFSIWPKWLLPPLHFSDFRGAIMCYCRIDQNGTVIGGGQFSVCVTWVTWVTSHHSDTKHWPTDFALPAPHPFEKGKRKWYLISLMNKIMHVIFSVVVVILPADKNPCQMLPTSSSFLQQARSSPNDFASLVWFFLYIKTFWLLRFFFTKKAFFMEISQKKCDI